MSRFGLNTQLFTFLLQVFALHLKPRIEELTLSSAEPLCKELID